MASNRTRRPSSRRRPPTALGKPRGVLHPRVQQVGPEHFGILCFDCAKVRSKFLLADFYGRILIPPKSLEIQARERDIASRLGQTLYLLLLSFPGVNGVSAADFAGELG